MPRSSALVDEPEPATSWIGAAACRREATSTFFEGPTAGAVAVCRSCPVAGACLDYALAERLTHGVWGGLTGEDRRRVAEARGLTWEPESPVRNACGANCDRWARPGRNLCARCAQRAYRASRR